jgi:S-(hydroxymethyl)glutathione dehydrogenase/alcohol dehydrogenase
VIQGARVCGASVIVAVDPAEAKHDVALRFGATHATTPDELSALQQELTGGEGFDYVFEVVGSPVTIRAAYDATRRGGTCTIVGVGRFDEQVSFSPFELFYKEVKLLGCVYGSSDVIRDFPRVLGLWKAGRIDLEGLISKRIALEDVQSAFDAMLAGEVIRSVISF